MGTGKQLSVSHCRENWEAKSGPGQVDGRIYITHYTTVTLDDPRTCCTKGFSPDIDLKLTLWP